jgi:hypothetical protein
MDIGQMTGFTGARERRNHARILLAGQITVHFKGGEIRWTETDATLVDLSNGGMFIRCDRMPRPGQRILVGLMHDDRGLGAAWGKAVRVDGWGGFGVEFDRTNERMDELVGEIALSSPGTRGEEFAGTVDGRIWIEAAL